MCRVLALALCVMMLSVGVLGAHNNKHSTHAATNKLSKLRARASTQAKIKDSSMTAQMPAIGSDGTINYEYTCFSADGTLTSPAVSWSGAPADTVSYALALYQLTEGTTASFHIYWFMYNIDPSVTSLVDNCSVSNPDIGTLGVNNNHQNAYMAVCAGGGGLRYYFLTVYAMDKMVFENIDPSTASIDLFQSLYTDSILDSVTLSMHYDKDVDGPSEELSMKTKVKKVAASLTNNKKQ